MTDNLKTDTDKLFECYLTQQKHKYRYEPFVNKSTIPDYLIYKKKVKVLVECEEIE